MAPLVLSDKISLGNGKIAFSEMTFGLEISLWALDFLFST